MEPDKTHCRKQYTAIEQDNIIKMNGKDTKAWTIILN